MAASLVTQNIFDWPNSDGTSKNHTIALPSVGDLLIFTICSNNGVGITNSITGGGVTTWAELKRSNFTNYHVAIWWGVVDGTPSTTVTSGYSGAKNGAVSISQYTGASAWSANANNATATATSTSKGGGSATPSGSGDHIHFVCSQHVSATDPSAGPTDGFTGLTQSKRLSGLGNGVTNNSAYRVDSGAATAGNPVWTIPSLVWEGVHGIITYTPSVAGDSKPMVGGGFF